MASYQPYRTSSDLVLEVLTELEVLATGQSVNPEDFDQVNKELDSIFRKLGALEIVYVPDPNNIPGEWSRDLAMIVAGEVARAFGASGQERAELVQAGLGSPPGSGTAAMSLRSMLRGRPTGEPLRTLSY